MKRKEKINEKRVLLFVMFVFALGLFTQAFAKGSNNEEKELAKKMKNPTVIENLNLASPKDKKLAEEGLFWAARYGKEEIAKKLLDKGVDVNAQIDDYFKLTPLHGAVSANRVKMVEFLISKGANVNAQYKPLSKDDFDGPISVNGVTEVGNTPLYVAAIFNSTKAAKILLENGADLSLEDVYGATPLDRVKSKKMKKLFLQYGAKSGYDSEKEESLDIIFHEYNLK